MRNLPWLLLLLIAAPLSAGDRPISGEPVESLKAFDRAVLAWMDEYKVQAGTLAVSRGGKMFLQRGYGFADARQSIPVTPDTPMRIASTGKPITAAAIRKVVREGKLTYDTKAFEFLGIDPPAGKWGDERLHAITIQHLLDHKGGWDRAAAGDPMFMMPTIRKELGLSREALPGDVVRWMSGRPLQFDPGTKSVYSNFGYCVLGRAVEKASGQAYLDYVQKEILKPIGVTRIFLSRDRAADRDAAEVMYPLKDGRFSTEVMDSHGGLAATAGDLCRFLDAYWINGQPRSPKDRGNWIFFGSLPGTSAMIYQHPAGVNVAVLFNGPANNGDAHRLDKLKELIEAAIKECGLDKRP